MGLSIYLYDENEQEVNHPYSVSTTHNLTTMADKLHVYEIIWHPDTKTATCSDVLPYLNRAYIELINNEDYYKQWDAANGWGTTKTFLKFLREYINMCLDPKYINCCVYACR